VISFQLSQQDSKRAHTTYCCSKYIGRTKHALSLVALVPNPGQAHNCPLQLPRTKCAASPILAPSSRTTQTALGVCYTKDSSRYQTSLSVVPLTL